MVDKNKSSNSQDDAATGERRPVRRVLPMVRPERSSNAISIGLVNNMAGAAFKATERQFVSLIQEACDGTPVHLSYYTLPGISSNEAGGQHFAEHYTSVDTLLDTHLDGIIVTGREPRMADLRDEPYWESFTQLLEWARTNTYSSVWSCLAAHAAVLHMDGIGRRKSEEKNFGVFDCEQISNHSLLQDVPQQFRVPHSRWNGVAYKDLAARGYEILSRVANDGVDTFIKQEQSLFVFFQGHLEYETDTLMREYRRDVGRYIKAESATYPPLPLNYFDAETAEALTVLRDKAAAFRTSELLSNVAAAIDETKIKNSWRKSAVGIYKNWLKHIEAQKALSERKVVPIAAASGGR
jgi:homoserine O-succinyltransferase